VSIKILATIGVTRLPYTLWGETPGNTSAELKDEQAAITSHAKDVYEIADESALLEESFKQQLATPVPLGDKPLIVLTAGPLQLADTSLSEEQIEQLNEAHTRTQAALTQGSQNAEQIIAEDSGHYIQVEQPDLVIEAIRRVVEAARNGSRV
jgi:pimeloyl-ACP methyl ester carboxylesterase